MVQGNRLFFLAWAVSRRAFIFECQFWKTAPLSFRLRSFSQNFMDGSMDGSIAKTPVASKNKRHSENELIVPYFTVSTLC